MIIGTNLTLSLSWKMKIVKIVPYVYIQVDRQIEVRRLDIVVMEKNTNKCLIIYVACTVDNNLILKRNKKLDN